MMALPEDWQCAGATGRLASEKGSDSPQMWTGSGAHLGTGQGPQLVPGTLLVPPLELELQQELEPEPELQQQLEPEPKLQHQLELEPELQQELELELLLGPPVVAAHHYISQ